MNLSGTLSDWTVGDLLNVMKVTGKTASLHINGSRRGAIHFSQGRVVGAALEGNSAVSGEFESRNAAADALFVLSGLEEGAFQVGAFEGPEAEGWEVENLLSDIETLNGLESDLSEAGLRGSFLMLREEIDKPVTVQVGDWWAIASLVSVLSFDQLEEVFGRGRAIRLLHTLWRMDLIEAVEDETPEEEEKLDESPAFEQVVEHADEPEVQTVDGLDEPEDTAERDDESWLDEIAASAESAPSGRPADEGMMRRVMGVAAPASTVLTGSVLDEMRRLRGAPTD